MMARNHQCSLDGSVSNAFQLDHWVSIEDSCITKAWCMGQTASSLFLGKSRARSRDSAWFCPVNLHILPKKGAYTKFLMGEAQRAARIFHQIAGDLARRVGKARPPAVLVTFFSDEMTQVEYRDAPNKQPSRVLKKQCFGKSLIENVIYCIIFYCIYFYDPFDLHFCCL